jgi:hypothetical protein
MTKISPIRPAPGAPAMLDIYSRQMEINAALAVIHEQLKAIPDHEQRIRCLEASRAKLIGAAMAASAIVSAIGTWIGLAVTHH